MSAGRLSAMIRIAESDWNLEIRGLVDRPRTFTLAQLKARPMQEVTFALECAGNRGFGSFIGAVHNARWGGTPLRTVLEEAGIQEGCELAESTISLPTLPQPYGCGQ